MNGKDGMYANEQEAVAEGLMPLFPESGKSGDPHYPQPHESSVPPAVPRAELGEPLTIHNVAELLGCSAWTVRQRYLRQGLPHLQARPRGKLVFFREQVIAWTLKRQRQKGGLIR